MRGFISNDSARSSAPATTSSPIGLPHVPPPRWLHYETDLSSILVFAPRQLPLEILQIADEIAREYCAQRGLEPGDRITRLDGGTDTVLVETDDGRRLRLALPVALLIEVEPALPS